MAADKKYAKHLDAWAPGKNSGDPIGCIATSFTFDSIFFEEECLARFVNIQSDPHTDGPVYLIEMEEKLAGLQCVAAIVDQHHCRGARNIRWDLLPARIPKGGVMHAKITILFWAQAIRLIISSANITEIAYRENQEVFAVMDYRMGKNSPDNLLESICSFIRQIISTTYSSGQNPAKDRLNACIDKILLTVEKWNIKKSKTKFPQIHTMVINPGGRNLFEQLSSQWEQNCYGVPEKAIVASPFYNPPEDDQNIPCQKIWDILRKRGKANVIYNARSEELSGRILVKAPETLKSKAPAYRKDTSVEIRTIDELIKDENKETFRPFHLKTIWLENKDCIAYMIGSSNFTSSGTGLQGTNNYESNLLYTLHKKRNLQACKMLRESLFIGRKTDTDIQFLTEAEINTDEERLDELKPLPSGFEKLILKIENGNKQLEMYFDPPLPEEFALYRNDDTLLYTEKEWIRNKKPTMDIADWNKESLPSGIFIRWKDSEGYSYWPVLVEDQKDLPPVEELKNLPLEFLIHLITSARPLHQVIRSWWKRKKEEKEKSSYPDTIIDPHKRLDASSYLLQRTRRVSNLLTAFRQRLERPVYTKEALHWRIYGPIGIEAISRAIREEGHSEEEKSFLLSELSLELSRINYQETKTSLPKKTVEKEIRTMIKKFDKEFRKSRKSIDPSMRKYISSAYKNALK